MQQHDVDQRIERYLLGRLSEQEEAEFEAYYLSNQDCLDQLEAARKLMQGLQLVEREPEAGLPVESSRRAANDVHWWQIRLPLWVAAAMMLMTLLPGILVFTQKSMDSNGVVSVTQVSLGGLRSMRQDSITLEASRGRQILGFYIDPALKEYMFPAYALRLTRAAQPVMYLRDLQRDQRQSMLYADLGVNRLVPGTYQYRLSGIRQGHKDRVLKQGIIQVK